MIWARTGCPAMMKGFKSESSVKPQNACHLKHKKLKMGCLKVTLHALRRTSFGHPFEVHLKRTLICEKTYRSQLKELCSELIRGFNASKL